MPGNDVIHPICDLWGRLRNFDFCSIAEPARTWPYMLWINPETRALRIRDAADDDWITMAGGGGAPIDASYIVGSFHADLTQERRLVMGDGLQATDGGPNGDYTLAVKVADFAGTGLENDGSNNLRIAAAAAGDGLTGGGGSALAVNSTVVRTSGDQDIYGVKTFRTQVTCSSGVTLSGWNGLFSWSRSSEPPGQIIFSASETSTIKQALLLRHQSTQNAAAGYGVRLAFGLDNGYSSLVEAAYVDAVWSNPTSGSETAYLSFKLANAGASPAEVLRLTNTALCSQASRFLDIGTTTLAEKLGNIYLSTDKDLFPDNDGFGLWTRFTNFGINPDEHWRQGGDDLVWIGWAAYTGYAIPSDIQHDYSQKRVRHSAATRAFYYRAAPTGNDIYLRQGASLWVTTTGAITLHVGVMIDDGVNAGDGLGANNYYRVMVEATGLTTNWNIRREYRVGGGAPVAAVTAYSLPSGDFYCPVLVAKQNPNWGNWWAGLYYRRSNARETLVQFDNPPFTWTPARVGIYYYVNGANNGFGLWDWYDESTS